MISVISGGGTILTPLLLYSKILELQTNFFLLLHTAYEVALLAAVDHVVSLQWVYPAGRAPTSTEVWAGTSKNGLHRST